MSKSLKMWIPPGDLANYRPGSFLLEMLKTLGAAAPERMTRTRASRMVWRS
jgi:hypothetical protein